MAEQLDLFEEDSNSLVPLASLIRSAAEQIYKVYPRKRGKFKAIQYLMRDLRDGVEAETILSGVRRFAKECDGMEEQFIPHASTFFNQRRWMDYEDHKPVIPDPPKALIIDAWTKVYGVNATVPDDWKSIDFETRAKLLKKCPELRKSIG